MMVKVAVIGASGYTGVELLRLLYRHPGVTVTAVTSEQSAGKPVSSVFPSLRGRYDGLLEPLDPLVLAEKADLVFTALPHQAAMRVVPAFLDAGLKVIDLSADYRLRDADVYAQWYEPHTTPDLLAEAVYGLPECYRAAIRPARLVANPGCYPTSVILALSPLLQAGLLEKDGIIVDAKSGTSGAGRSAKVDSLYCEVNESFKAYGVGGVHRHIPEIEQELSIQANGNVCLTFTPHLVPMDRGILSTIYAAPRTGVSAQELQQCLESYYVQEPFVRVLPPGQLPATGFVKGSNCCDIAVTIDKRSGRVIVVSAIDNLVKGASGQAVQNMNLLLGLPETTGLEGIALYP